MVKNNRLSFRVTDEMKENFTLKANSLNLSLNEFFELLCNKDIGFLEKDLYGRGLKRKGTLNNNETEDFCFNSNKEISKGEKEI
jgi:hypothetical protein